MNEKIEDERGLMEVHDFKKMFYTSFRYSTDKCKDKVYELLLPLLIKHDMVG